MLLQGQRHSLCILGFQDQYLGQSKAIGHDHRIEEDTTEFNCLVTYPFSDGEREECDRTKEFLEFVEFPK